MSKRYYWLKLKNDFFNQREIKKLRRIAGGDTFTIIYLKMQLLSIQSEGVLKFEGTEESLSEQLALELDEDEDNIKLTLAFLSQNNLIEQISDSEFLMPQATQSLGSEVYSAERVRRHRDKKTLQCNTDVTQGDADVTKSNTEIEIEIENREKRIEIENREREKNDTPTDTVSDTLPKPKSKPKKITPAKSNYGEYSNVLLTDEEYNKLLIEIPNASEYIEKLSTYMESTGKTYKSHIATIRHWFRTDKDKVKTETTKQKGSAIDDFMKEMEARNGSTGFY